MGIEKYIVFEWRGIFLGEIVDVYMCGSDQLSRSSLFILVLESNSQ